MKKTVGIVANPNNSAAITVSTEVAKWLIVRGINVVVEQFLAEKISSIGATSGTESLDLADLIIVFGGDGTILYTVRLLEGKDIPLFGVNLGGLGFLTAVTTNELYPMLEKVLEGEFETEERMMLSFEIYRKEKKISSYSVLNDVVIKGEIARLIQLETRINNEYVNTYRAYGLIIATPTGSTAYSLSTGGPILYPSIHSIIVAPICPFNLTNRPVVIPDWMDIEVIVKSESSKPFVTLDGQIDVTLQKGDIIKGKRANHSIHLLKSPTKSYFDVLRERLLWDKKA